MHTGTVPFPMAFSETEHVKFSPAVGTCNMYKCKAIPKFEGNLTSATYILVLTHQNLPQLGHKKAQQF